MAVKTLEAPIALASDHVVVKQTERTENTLDGSPLFYSSLNRTLTGWEVVFYTFITLLGTALLVDLWFLLHPGV